MTIQFPLHQYNLHYINTIHFASIYFYYVSGIDMMWSCQCNLHYVNTIPITLSFQCILHYINAIYVLSHDFDEICYVALMQCTLYQHNLQCLNAIYIDTTTV